MWEPIEEGLVPLSILFCSQVASLKTNYIDFDFFFNLHSGSLCSVEMTRHVSMISITLSTSYLNKDSPGYASWSLYYHLNMTYYLGLLTKMPLHGSVIISYFLLMDFLTYIGRYQAPLHIEQPKRQQRYQQRQHLQQQQQLQPKQSHDQLNEGKNIVS